MASNRLKDINDELTPLIAQAKQARIVDVDESTFKRKLLPLAVARYSNVEYELELTHWQDITGERPTHGVRVFRNDEFLFETPPLILSPEVVFQGNDLLTNLKEAERRERSGLPKGDIMDSDNLQPSLNVKDLGKALNTWIAIFKFYGITLDILDDDGNVIGNNGLGKVDTPNEEVSDASTAPVSAQWEDDDEDAGEVL